MAYREYPDFPVGLSATVRNRTHTTHCKKNIIHTKEQLKRTLYDFGAVSFGGITGLERDV